MHKRNTLEQLKLVGPRSLGVSLLTAGFVGMVFTIQVSSALTKMTAAKCTPKLAFWCPQFVREFAKLGLTRSVGGVLALALTRELTPVITSIILAGKACR